MITLFRLPLSKSVCYITLVFFWLGTQSHAQIDSTLFRRVAPKDTSIRLNADAVYDRPFLQVGKVPVSVGGYVEANSHYRIQEGITDGLTFRMPRLSLFVSSAIGKRIKFLSEIEFENGTKEINIEFAALDFEFHPLLNLRTGIVMNPIGAFNQNHDGPKWEFIDRPISATTIIPSTWSNVGFGIWGKYYKDQWAMGYEAYLTNGFDDRIIDNPENRTWLLASKSNPNRFEQSFNGVPMVTCKGAIRHRKYGEFGLSWMGGVYNRFLIDGLQVDKKRRIDLLAVDFNTTLPTGTGITGEWVWCFVDVPRTFTQQFGNRQQGGFLDVVQPILKRPMLGFEDAVLNLCLRTEYVDYNTGTFRETGGNIGDHILAFVPAVSFRPYQQTVLRANYRYEWNTDLIGNPPIRAAVFQVGVSSYF